MSQQDLIKEIGQIRSLMERSSKFMSISGLSGILIGSYALIGAFFGYITVYGYRSDFRYRDNYITDSGIIGKLVLIAGLVLLLSILTGFLMARYKAKKNNQTIWNATSKGLLTATAIPLLTGGLFSLLLVYKGEYGLIASSLLIFYGLALCAASTFTFKEARWLGLMDIVLGLLALCFPGYGLWFWAIGFGLLHIIYGIIVHQRYEK
ncbi:hypothetical protein [Sphingobacterium yanglingense]|uniref:Uncharacterized protein n=1 Tax=Sphingobacterium yanglingense TaxID=1437280 RepID=A0A4V3DDJ3_9SPHI|nr:hypothetical protein [Sphingobacterium yanglingense]TDQ76974.1 hypothetical protein CLV99_2366 [Sphingobacterium yanglingense]